MKWRIQRYYYIYIVTDKTKTDLQVGLTANMQMMLTQLDSAIIKAANENDGNEYKHLVYWERLDDAGQALKRTQEIKEQSVKKQRKMIAVFNPNWEFLNEEMANAMI